MPLTIRLATLADAAAVQAIYAPYCDTPISFELEPPSIEEMRRRLATISGPLPWLVTVDDGQVLGYAYASPHRERAAYRWSVDVTIYLDQNARRRGLGRALYTSLFQIVALQGYINAYAGITLPNPASVGLHEAMGFERVGIYKHVGFKGGAWHDFVWYQRLLQPCPAEPVPTRSRAEAQASPVWDSALRAGLATLST